jgi:hypothetical protein
MTEPIARESNPYGHSSSHNSTSTRPYGSEGPKKSSVLSIISMIAGIVSLPLFFLYFGVIPAVAAIIIGHIAQRKEKDAKGFWITGLVTGYLGLVIGIVWIVFSVWVVGAALEELPSGTVTPN